MGTDLIMFAFIVVCLASIYLGLNFGKFLDLIFRSEKKPRTPEEEWLDRQI